LLANFLKLFTILLIALHLGKITNDVKEVQPPIMLLTV